ncbi:hypothetical protein CA54_21960 [Symmachiella macrocystis]|uniref:Cytochrome c domain-containing protein n=1 Tax=Symmachiella macrocystis TaxID=2527985 RepID=A0A5C6BPN6_9PLAN|nr:DUF1553 domain-containing protein [Symmachiella macrocystis]TWU13361.1 hypothetical protein CA54_21960 [Symmachiella macrocystis]
MRYLFNIGWICVLGLWLLSTSLHAQQPVTNADLEKEVTRVAALIDKHIVERWAAEGISPAPEADDAEFCRRVYLSIAGRIPHVSEITDFLEETSSRKRRHLVDVLLESNGYVNNFTIVWSNVLIPEADQNIQTRFLKADFEHWLSLKLVGKQTRYNEMVTELLVASLADGIGNGSDAGSPTAFYQAKEFKPENLAAATSRMFLGVRLECAQCHEHPFDGWSQKQFWSQAAFFAQIRSPRQQTNLFSRISQSVDRAKIAIPDSDTVVEAAFLDGNQPTRKQGQSVREEFAEWITAPENPYFAKTAANRMWSHLFGIGIVDPVDDFSDIHPPSHPQLLDELARELIAHDFDLKFLIRAITATRVYQLSSRQTDPSQADRQQFARMLPRPMSPEQLINSLSYAIGRPDYARAQNFNLARTTSSDLFEVFGGNSESPSERTATILQALTMMNSQLIVQATDKETSGTLAAVLDIPWLNTPERIETLYLATVSRPPRAEELSRLVKYVESGGTKNDQAQALGDLFWVLLNSTEFLLNH